MVQTQPQHLPRVSLVRLDINSSQTNESVSHLSGSLLAYAMVLQPFGQLGHSSETKPRSPGSVAKAGAP